MQQIVHTAKTGWHMHSVPLSHLKVSARHEKQLTKQLSEGREQLQGQYLMVDGVQINCRRGRYPHP